MHMAKESTIYEVLSAVNEFATNVEGRFNKIDKRLTKIESTMVTKEYLDEKLSDLRGDLTILIRKEDTKLKTVIDILFEKKIFTEADKKRVLTLEPFPQLSL